MEQTPQSQLKLLVAKGKEQGYLTYAEVNDHLPQDIVDSDQIEDIIQMINDILRQMIVHLGIGQVTLFFALGNEEFKLRLRGMLHRTHPVGVASLRQNARSCANRRSY